MLNQQNNVDSKQKRIRHLKSLMVKNLQVVEDRGFSVWFTMHLSRYSNAFYISEKKENERNPKWNLTNLPKSAAREFLVRVWIKDSKLRLLIEMEVNLSYLIYLSETNLNYSVQNYENFFIFEMFDCLWTEPLFSLRTSTSTSTSSSSSSSAAHSHSRHSHSLSFGGTATAPGSPLIKNSYTLNLMIRVHDFQRVIYETRRKIGQLKQTSLGKFEASQRLRQLQRTREIRAQEVMLLHEQFGEISEQLDRQRDEKRRIEDSVRMRKESLAKLNEAFHLEKQRYSMMEKSLESSINTNSILKNELFLRQKQLVRELSRIFAIQRLEQLPTTMTSSRASLQPLAAQQQQQQQHKLKILNSCIRLWPSAQSNTINSSSNYDRENSIAIGHVAHAAHLLAAVLGVPLRYPIVYRSSKSFIVEHVGVSSSVSGGGDREPRMLALFRQTSTQEEHFLYAVNLLNADLVQIRVLFDNAAHRNVDHSDLLVNLKWIFDFFNKS